MAKVRPSELELQVLGVLWDRGPSTVRDVMSAMPDGKRRAYTTVLSVLQVMEKKGLATHAVKGRAHLYRASVRRTRVVRPVLKDLVAHLFAGSTTAAVQQLLREGDVTPEDLDEIRRLLDEHDAAGGD